MRRLTAFIPSNISTSIAWSLFAGVYTGLLLVGLFSSGFTTFAQFDLEIALFVFFGAVFLSASVSWWIVIERDARYTYVRSLNWALATVGASFLLNILYILVDITGLGDSIIVSIRIIIFGFLILGIPALLMSLLIGMVGAPIFMYARRRYYNSQSASR